MLKPKELQILTLLAEGFNYKETARQLDLHPSQMPLLCHQIRQKTGIESTQSAIQCRAWLSENPDPLKAKPIPSSKRPTAKQLQAMELYAVGRKSMDHIAYVMEINRQGAENHLVLGMNRARIEPRGLSGDRRKEIIEYLTSIGYPMAASTNVEDY